MYELELNIRPLFGVVYTRKYSFIFGVKTVSHTK
jgi:hypothetical protein